MNFIFIFTYASRIKRIFLTLSLFTNLMYSKSLNMVLNKLLHKYSHNVLREQCSKASLCQTILLAVVSKLISTVHSRSLKARDHSCDTTQISLRPIDSSVLTRSVINLLPLFTGVTFLMTKRCLYIRRLNDTIVTDSFQFLKRWNTTIDRQSILKSQTALFFGDVHCERCYETKREAQIKLPL